MAHRLEEAARRARSCTNCELYRDATQTVFGEGAPRARMMLVGEQPGDAEDRTGRPFVGPAGRVLDDALAAAGIDRSTTYVTNAVKHFRFEHRGKRRIHKKPAVSHIRACRPWLDEEIAATMPRIVVCLGATAAQALLGSGFRVSKQRGRVLEPDDLPPVLATAHPSSVLRADDEDRREAFDALVADLRVAAAAMDDRASA